MLILILECIRDLEIAKKLVDAKKRPVIQINLEHAGVKTLSEQIFKMQSFSNSQLRKE